MHTHRTALRQKAREIDRERETDGKRDTEGMREKVRQEESDKSGFSLLI